MDFCIKLLCFVSFYLMYSFAVDLRTLDISKFDISKSPLTDFVQIGTTSVVDRILYFVEDLNLLCTNILITSFQLKTQQ